MPVAQLAGQVGNGPAFLISAGIVYEIIAANVSSPQTTELNAKDRAETLMKWVHIGQLQSAGFIAVAAGVDRGHRPAILAGGITAMVIMELLYLHARTAGMASVLPGTEEHSARVRPGMVWPKLGL